MTGVKTSGAVEKKPHIQKNVHDRSKSTSDAGYSRPYRAYQQCNGSHRPGTFLWLSFVIQAGTGITAPTMWLGIFAALLLCLAAAVAYAEISKLYPGTDSSYYYAEQALLSKDKFFKYARVAKFIVGWGSHLYYWVYPGVMVAVTAA
jgi:amino acid transporter